RSPIALTSASARFFGCCDCAGAMHVAQATNVSTKEVQAFMLHLLTHERGSQETLTRKLKRLRNLQNWQELQALAISGEMRVRWQGPVCRAAHERAFHIEACARLICRRPN